MKSKRVTNSSGTVVSTVELDPWGGNTNRNNNDAFQPRAFNNYTRDANASDEAMFRRYNRWWSRFDQPDPYGGSYNLADPQSFNRYPYTQNDPVNLEDPTGLLPSDGQCQGAECPWGGGGGGFWGGGFNMNNHTSLLGGSGRQTILEAEYEHAWRYHPENNPVRFRSAFSFLSWGGFMSIATLQYPTRTEEQKRKDYVDCMNQAAAEYRQRAADEERATRDFVIGYNTQTGDPSGLAATVGVGLFNKFRKLSFRVGAGITIAGRYAVSRAHMIGHEIGNYWVGYRRAVAECQRKARLP